VRTKPETLQQVKQGLLEILTDTRTEAGCINYDLHQSNDDPCVFLLYENWLTGAALDAHLQTPHVQTFLSKAETLTAEPVDICRYTMIRKPNRAES
jgi:quinol monooxygenase YgiN